MIECLNFSLSLLNMVLCLQNLTDCQRRTTPCLLTHTLRHKSASTLVIFIILGVSALLNPSVEQRQVHFECEGG